MFPSLSASPGYSGNLNVVSGITQNPSAKSASTRIDVRRPRTIPIRRLAAFIGEGNVTIADLFDITTQLSVELAETQRPPQPRGSI